MIKKADVPQIRLHNLRHTLASWLLSTGDPVKSVQARLGHADAQITLSTYGHFLPEAQKASAAKMEGILGGDVG